MYKFGLVGKNIEYSLSPFIHNFFADKLGININYDLISIDKFNLKVFKEYDGLNITIPYKEETLQLDCSRDTNVTAYQMSNTYSKKNDQLYLTDICGLKSLLNINPIVDKSYCILGTGAMSKLSFNILIENGVEIDNILVVSRNKSDQSISYSDLNCDKLSGYIVINTTPVINNNQSLTFNLNLFSEVKKIIDLNYTPNFNLIRKFSILNKIEYQSGLKMLIKQASESFEIWTDLKINQDLLNLTLRKIKLHSANKLIIIGMPFSGKTTHSDKLNEDGVDSIDLDKYITKKIGIEISDFIREYSISIFRKIEHYYFKQLLDKKEKLIIFCGGGTLNQDNNINLLEHQMIIYIKKDLNVLKGRFTKSRGNIESIDKLESIYNQRKEKYNHLADYISIDDHEIEGICYEYINN